MSQVTPAAGPGSKLPGRFGAQGSVGTYARTSDGIVGVMLLSGRTAGPEAGGEGGQAPAQSAPLDDRRDRLPDTSQSHSGSKVGAVPVPYAQVEVTTLTLSK